MSCSHPDYKNYARSAVALVIGLPLTLGLSSIMNTAADMARDTRPTAAQVEADNLKETLTLPCLRWVTSKDDSRLERDAENAIDDIMGGDVNHQATCNWVL